MPRILVIIFLFTVCLSCNKEDLNTGPKVLEDISGVADYDAKIQQGVSLMFFHATWCSICASQRPDVEGLVKDPSLSKVTFGQVDFEKNKDTNQKYNITGFPTITIYKDGVEKHRLSGKGHTQEKLTELLKALL
ncbi:MAG: thioredoxin family protein [Saprospiraceae bacterium]|nr:thioredoxin family protein [Saprospiraceae bacterium]